MQSSALIRNKVGSAQDATYERLELGGVEWRLAADSLNHVLRDLIFDGPLEERWTLWKAGLVALEDLDLVAIELDEGLKRKVPVIVDLHHQIGGAGNHSKQVWPTCVPGIGCR